MTSASELFTNRRSRIGGRPELGFVSSSAQAYDRHHRRRHPRPFSRHHETSSSYEPSREEMREEMEEFDLFLRRSAWHPTYRDYGPVQVDHLPSHTSPGNSSSNGNSSSRANRMHFSRSDELPGDVLLARERLFERLRGVSLSSNRQSSRLTSGIPWDEISYNEADTADLDLLEASIDRLAEENPLNGLVGDTLLSSRRSPLTVRSSSLEARPRGLIQQEISSLLREAFTCEDEEVVGPESVTVCSICLSNFHQGDELIRVPCQHMFHASCLCPWVQICGDCPNCRAAVIV